MRWRFLGVMVAACLVAEWSASTGQEKAPDILAWKIQVLNGDTLIAEDERISLWGIDAPERDQMCTRGDRWFHCGAAAAAWLERTAAVPVACDRMGTDDDGRTLALCASPLGDLAALLVREGWAVTRREIHEYAVEEASARRAGHGMWAGSFVHPADWRRGIRLAGENEPWLRPTCAGAGPTCAGAGPTCAR